MWLISCLAFAFAFANESAKLAARTSSRDVEIPKALVTKIEDDYRAFLKTKEAGAKGEASIKRGLVNIVADFRQKKVGALHENTHVAMPTGGGVVDFAEVVTPVRGAFNLKLELKRQDGTPLATSRVYFVSRAKRRTIAGETYGAGCDTYMDVSTAYHKKWAKTGFDLYTADQRYLSVMGGTFIFTEFTPEALLVGSVTFTDARYPELICE